MKNVIEKPLDLDPETVSNLSDEQAEEVQGGGSCNKLSCFFNAMAEEDLA